MNRSYDVIVAGFRPGGLLAGALLARQGLRVLAINQDAYAPTKVGAFTFPSHRYPLVSVDDSEFLGGALEALGIHPTERQTLRPSLPSFQVVQPGHRVDLYPDERFDRELKREFRDDDVVLEAFYARVKEDAGQFIQAWNQKRSQPPTRTLMQKVGLGSMGLREKELLPGRGQTLREVLDQMQASAAVRTFLCAQLIAFGYLADPESLPMPVAAHLLTAARFGVYRDAQHIEPLVHILLERLKELRADVLPQRRITRLDFRWGRLAGLSFMGEAEAGQTEFLLWNADFQQILPLLPDSVRRRGYQDRYGEVPYELFSIFLAIRQAVIPVGMHDHLALVADDEAPLEQGNLVLVSVSPEGAEAFGPPDARALTLSTPVPASAELRSAEVRRRIATQMMMLLKHVIPYLEDHILTLHVPIPRDPEEAGPALLTAEGLQDLYGADVGGGTRLPHWNLFHLGRETYPALGLDGEIGAGMMVAEAIDSMQEK